MAHETLPNAALEFYKEALAGTLPGESGASTVADGANVVEGAVADAAATAGGTGTISAKLRRISTQLPAAVGPTAKAAALSVTTATDDPIVALTGAVNETAPATDTASSGANGRLQRIAQRLTSSIGAETTVTPTHPTLSANTATLLLAANSNRIRAIIYNPLATTLFVRKAVVGTSPATVTAGGYDFVIPSGATFISDNLEWAGQYNGICATAGDINVSESV